MLKKLSAMSADSIDDDVEILPLPVKRAKPVAAAAGASALSSSSSSTRQQKKMKRRKRPVAATTSMSTTTQLYGGLNIKGRGEQAPPRAAWRASTEKSWSDASMQNLFS